MNDSKPIGLTGEGFTREEIDEIYEDFQPIPMTPEERKEYLAELRRAYAPASPPESDSPVPVEKAVTSSPIGLTGEVFSREEADDFLRHCPLPEMTPEARKEYIEHLNRVLASTSPQGQEEQAAPTESRTRS